MQRPSRFRQIVASALLSAAMCGVAHAATVLKAPREVVWADFLGVNVQFQYFAPDIYQQQMSRLDELGLNWVRLTIHWPVIEPKKDSYALTELDAAMAAIKAHNYNTVAYLVGSAPFASSASAGAKSRDQYPPTDFNVFAARMTALAQRYPQVNNWQVWNEPNIVWLPKEDPTAYGRLLTTTANAIRAALPDKTIVTAGMAYYSQMHSTSGYMLQTLLDNGLGQQNIVAAYHPYSEYPEGDSLPDRDFLVRANAMNQLLHSNGVKQVWATEWGWSSYAGPVEMQHLIGTSGQADYTLRRLALMSAMDFQRIFLFNLSDLDERASARDQGYGLLDLQASPKPVYTALQNFLKITGPRLQPAEPPAVSRVPDDLYAVPWTREDGTHLLMFWSATGTSLNFPNITDAVVHDPLSGSRTPLSASQGVTLLLKPTLQILEWKP
ncbi:MULTISPECIES: cellulase family glycosylhydrolase [Pseudomonas]|nr:MULTISPECIES: cellulase family glycosylhydrolase [Pseudomonas]KTB71447.1 beta-xylosidase [Pseudomonas sp. ICMP 3272]KTC51989.1 beta-xylosidase [Pseudomonas syringae ICMP 19498]RMP10745.1 Glycosyl hydrolase, family 5 [Pseudomonas syringae pv. persicae]RMQ08795.1 Glycosyl hydrolase, family 5 [Pseudomonas viridiflava]